MNRPTRTSDLFERPPDDGLYGLAPLYDFVYRRAFDYDGQAERVRAAGARESVLELACGTGALAERLAGSVEYLGVDVSAAMLAVARRNVDAHFVQADARRASFDRPFDVVALLGRSTGHLGTGGLSEVTSIAREHLDGGALLLDAHDRAVLEDGYTSEDHYGDDRWSIVYRGESHTTGGGWCTHEYGFDVTDLHSGETRTFEGSYQMRFWGADELESLVGDAGFDAVDIEASEGILRATVSDGVDGSGSP